VFSAGKFPGTFAEEASGWRTRDTDIRHDSQLIPHFADVSADKFELASAPSCGMPIGGRSVFRCTLHLEGEGGQRDIAEAFDFRVHSRRSHREDGPTMGRRNLVFHPRDLKKRARKSREREARDSSDNDNRDIAYAS